MPTISPNSLPLPNHIWVPAQTTPYRYTNIVATSIVPNSLTVAAQLQHLAALPGGAHGRSDLGRGLALAVHGAGLTASGGEATELAVLVRRVADPVDAGVIADHRVHRVDHDALEPAAKFGL